MENNEKLTPREWIENIWYHYKWQIIFGGVFAIFLFISIGQMISNDEPDLRLLHVGPMYISTEAADRIEETLVGMSEDYNDDGEINVDLLDITINKFGTDEENAINYDQNAEGYKRFQTEIRAGDAVIYLLDEEYFKICVDEGLLTPFEEIIDDAYMPENVIDGCGVKLSELKAYELSGLQNVPEGAILCLRRSPAKDELSYGRTEEDWEGNKKTFVNIIKYGN